MAPNVEWFIEVEWHMINPSGIPHSPDLIAHLLQIVMNTFVLHVVGLLS